ncbi:MAG: Ldh family oxidoreductase [Burkholderiaceae bacterium]
MNHELVNPAPLADLITAIFKSDGCEDAEARIVAEHLVDASLRGHDSHGVIRTQRYHHWLQIGQIKPNQSLLTIADAGPLIQLDAQSGMGQRMAGEAIELGINRAREQGVALIAMRRAGHIGRVGAYAEQACRAGLVSISFVNVAGSRLVAPFGSSQRCLSTAPIAIGVPNPGAEDFILDFATSMVAEGKALVASQGGKPLPEGALISGTGTRSSDPVDLYGDTIESDVPNPRAGAGALRTMGEHKGSGLALACELLAGVMTGNGANDGNERTFGNGLLSILVEPERLNDQSGFAREVADYLAYVHEATPEAGVEKVLTPGDPERALRKQRLSDGLPVPVAVFSGITGLAGELGLGELTEKLKR